MEKLVAIFVVDLGRIAFLHKEVEIGSILLILEESLDVHLESMKVGSGGISKRVGFDEN